jgi:hypothetical protein
MTKEQGPQPTALRRKWLVGSVVAAVATVSAVVGFSGPAAADPVLSYVGVGSDTTQDVMDAVAEGVGFGAIGSYDAVDPTGTVVSNALIKTKDGGCLFTRPNGSGAGLAQLQYSINSATGNQPGGTKPTASGCVDFGRSSSPPSFNAGGKLVYIPFALDAVTSATGPASAASGTDPAVATEIVDANSFTKANLTTLYSCTAITINNKKYDPTVASDDPNATPPVVAVHLKVPQGNSGTRKFWAQQLNFDDGTASGHSLPSCVKDTWVDSSSVSHLIEEHDGTVYANDANALGPFSVAQFIAQSGGINPRLHHVAIHSLGTTDPTTQNPTTNFPTVNGSTRLKTTFVITREVYNIVELARITVGDPKFDAGLAQLFVGTGSLVCGLSVTIQTYGFATLATAPAGHTCGATSPNLTAVPTI